MVDTVTTPNDSYLRSYQAAINAGVPLVMVSLATYTRIDPDNLAVFSTRVMQTDACDKQMHFMGVIVLTTWARPRRSPWSRASRAIGLLSAAAT